MKKVLPLLLICLLIGGCKKEQNTIEWQVIANNSLPIKTVVSIPHDEHSITVYDPDGDVEFIFHPNGSVKNAKGEDVTDIRIFAKSIYRALEIAVEQVRVK